MNLNKYKGSGSGLDKIALQKIYTILEKINKNNINILEFGSGQSTQFLIDYNSISNKNIFIDSFDNDINYCYKNNYNYPNLNLHILPLISCNEEKYNEQINNKQYNRDFFTIHKSLPYNHPKFWREIVL